MTPQQISRTPMILVADDVLDESGIAALEADLARARAAEEEAGTAARDSAGLSFEFAVAASAMGEKLRAAGQALLGLENRIDATLRFRHYGEGEAHPPHCDHFEIDGAHLVATALFHLRDTPAGGATRFPHALPGPVEATPRRGRLVAWMNHDASGAPDPRSLHEGAPVVAGEKVTLTQFLYMPLDRFRAAIA